MLVRYDDQVVMSPSQVMLWLRCPYMWQNRSKVINDNMRLGHYTANVIKAHRKQQIIPTPQTPEQAIAGRAAIEAADTTTFALGVPLATELKLGSCRIDEVFGPPMHIAPEDEHYSSATIIDYKYVKDRLSENDLTAMGNFYEYQLLHYAWAYSQYTQTWSNPKRCRYEVGLCVFADDLSVDVRTFTVNHKRLSLWLDYATHLWVSIPRLFTWRNPLSCNTALYGECPLYKECWNG